MSILSFSQGVDVETVSKRLGHARASTTTDIYVHALRRPDIEASEKMDNLFNKKTQTETSKQKHQNRPNRLFLFISIYNIS